MALLTSLKLIAPVAPSIVTVLLLSTVMAGKLLLTGLIEPEAFTSMSPAADVLRGVGVAVSTVVAPRAWPARAASRGATATAATRDLRIIKTESLSPLSNPGKGMPITTAIGRLSRWLSFSRKSLCRCHAHDTSVNDIRVFRRERISRIIAPCRNHRVYPCLMILPAAGA